MTRPTTTQKGLGWAHVRGRRAALAVLRDGDPCARCEAAGIYHPMYRWQARWLDLDDFPGRMFGGPQVKRLSHRKCNRSAGARAGNLLRAAIAAAASPVPGRISRTW